MKIGDTITHAFSGASGVLQSFDKANATVLVGDDEQVWLTSHIEGYVEPIEDTAPPVELDKPNFEKTEAPVSVGTFPFRPPPSATF